VKPQRIVVGIISPVAQARIPPTGLAPIWPINLWSDYCNIPLWPVNQLGVV